MSSGVSKVSCAWVTFLICAPLCGTVSGADSSTAPGAVSTPTKSTAKASSEDTAPATDFSSILDKFPGKPDISSGMFNRSRSEVFPPGPVTLPNRRSRQSEEKDWAFTTPDDAFRHFMANDILRIPQLAPDATGRNSSSVMERYYERASGGASNGPSVLGVLDLRNFIVGRQRTDIGDSSSSATLPDLNSPVPGAPRLNLDSMATKPDSSIDFFATSRTISPADMLLEREAEQKHLEAFRNAMNYGNQTTTLPGINASTLPAPTRSQSGLTSLPGLAGTAKPNSYENPAAVYSPDPTRVSGLGAAPAAPAAPEPPGYGRPPALTPRMGPPKADFSMPQRKF